MQLKLKWRKNELEGSRKKEELCVSTAHWRAVVQNEEKEEGSDFAEPSLEGPVG
jgi:hypothetical protein